MLHNQRKDHAHKQKGLFRSIWNTFYFGCSGFRLAMSERGSNGLTKVLWDFQGFTLYWTFPHYVSICSWTCIYSIMAQSDLTALPPRVIWIFVLSVSAMLIVFLMYVNKSVHMYIPVCIHLHIYASPYAQVWACMYMHGKKKKKNMVLYMIMNMFTIIISKVIWQVWR